jgi:hypothetical protein
MQVHKGWNNMYLNIRITVPSKVCAPCVSGKNSVAPIHDVKDAAT